MRVVLKGIHKVKARLSTGEIKSYYYAWRGGPQIKGKPGTPEFVREYREAHTNVRQSRAGTFMAIIARYKEAPEFTRRAQSTRRAYLMYIKLIEDEFGDLPLGALADRRVRGEFKSWRDKFGNTPRKADFAWTVLARILSFAKDRGIIAVNPCERGGRLYSGSRRDKVWSEKDIASLLSVAPKEIQLALMLAIWTGQRQGDLLRLPWSGYDGTPYPVPAVQDRPAHCDARRRAAEGTAGPHRAPGACDPDQHEGPPMDRGRVQVVLGQAVRPRRHRRPHVP